jgi:hypothetical protein
VATALGSGTVIGHLATITSAAENAFIVSKVNAPGFGSFSWIGLRNFTGIPGNFSWVTGEPLSYTNWGFNEPNNIGGTAGTVAEPFVHITEPNGQWHDLSNLPLPFLAEFDAPLIRWRQYSGPANGSNLGVGVYTICYERTNVITNQRDSCCFTVTLRCTATTGAEPANANIALNKGVKDLVSSFGVSANPNPAPNSFTLKVASDDSKGRISLKVIDVAGRVVEAKDGLAPNQTLQIGNKYRPGVYLIQVMQGNKTAVLKLTKQAD